MATFESKPVHLHELLKQVVSGKTQLPDFQRGWVWDDSHIRSLLTSVARAFPIGAVMLLQAGGEMKFKVRPVEGLDANELAGVTPERLILDGQQRITSLTQVLMLDQPVQTRTEKKRKILRRYYIDIEQALEGPEHYEDAIVSLEADRTIRTNFGKDIKLDLRTREAEYDRMHFPCNKIFDRNDWEQGLIKYDANQFGRYMEFRSQVLEQFDQYDIPVIELTKENSKEAVCVVFEKVNTGGVPLSVFELITATYAADGVNLRDEWYGRKKTKTQAAAVGLTQRLKREKLCAGTQSTDFFQGLSLLRSYARQQEDLAAGKTGKAITGVSAKRDAVLNLPLDAYRQLKEPLTGGFLNAAKFLHGESFFHPRDLPYRTQMVPLAATLTLLGDRWLEPKIYDRLRQWFWCGVLGELYGGAVETRMANDVQQLMRWIDNGGPEPDTVRDANFQSGRLDTLRTRNSAAYKGINVLVQRNGAQDFFWKSTIKDLDSSDWMECKLEIHHIFPQKWCNGQGIDSKRYNSILNKTPISYKANKMIGGAAPSEYLPKLQRHKSVGLDDEGMDRILRTHLMDPQPLRDDDYDGFIESRRQLILSRVAEAMGKPFVESDGVDTGEDDED